MKKITAFVLTAVLLVGLVLLLNGCASTTSGKLANEDTELLAYQNIGGVAEITGIGAYPKTDLIIPEEIAGLPVVSVGEDAFEDSMITSVVIADSVTDIKANAFRECYNLASITLGNGVERIDYAFSGCDSLNDIYVSDLSIWCGIDFIDQALLKNSRNLYIDGELISNNLVIPDGVTSIPRNAFAYCESIISVTIPESVTEIGEFAFSDCTNIEEVTIPDSVSEIGRYAFHNCCNLNTITLPGALSCIRESTFEGCNNLSSIGMPNCIEEIYDNAFADCENLFAVYIPESVTYIGIRAFYNCSNLSELEIKGDKVSFGHGAFSECYNLSNAKMPDSLKHDFLYFR